MPLRLSVTALAKALAIDTSRLNDIVRRRRGISADTASRLGRFRGTSAEFWIGLQADYELRGARREKLEQIEREVRPQVG